MSTIVIKTIKGRRYRYLQRSYRQGGKVRTESLYLGPIDGGRRKGILRRLGAVIEANRAEPGTKVMNDMVDRWEQRSKAQAAAEKQAEDDFYDRMHGLYGMTRGAANPEPIDKVPASAASPAPAPDKSAAAAEAPATESPSAEEGAGEVDAVGAEPAGSSE